MREVHVNPASGDEHISSFVVQHRPEAAAALRDYLARAPGTELAHAGDVRSIVLCEGENQYVIVERIEELRAIPGVLNVAMVYHHAEPREALDAPLAPAAGALP